MILPGIETAGGGQAARATHIGHAVNGADLTTYNFGNFTATEAGLMVVGIVGLRGQTVLREVASVSIDGAAATIHVNPTGDRCASCLASRLVAAGSHAVSATFNDIMSRAGCAVWLLTRLRSPAPRDTDGVNINAGGASWNMSLDIPAGGVALYVAQHSADNDTLWSAAGERVDVLMEVGRLAAADHAPALGAMPHVENISWSSGIPGISAASWR